MGPALPGFELRLADDGEILLRGAGVMRGYRNRPEATAEVIDADGWLSTGDIGELDDNGYLKIVDRKKELIINAAGKNMSPANIESAIKAASPLIANAVAIGDRRPYNVALITLDPDALAAFAGAQALDGATHAQLAAAPQTEAAIAAAVETANGRLARVEQIKRFHVVGDRWEPGGEELTPTMKLKRKPIAARYGEEIEALYA